MVTTQNHETLRGRTFLSLEGGISETSLGREMKKILNFGGLTTFQNLVFSSFPF